MRAKFLLIGVIIIGLITLAIFFLPLFFSNDPSSMDKSFLERTFSNGEPSEKIDPYVPPGEQAGMEGSGSSEALSPNCQESQISYSVQNLNSISVCNTNSSGKCIDKSVTCSLDIYNFDDSTSGIFAIRFFVVEQGENTENSFANASVQTNVEFDNNATLTNQFDFQDENANKNLACVYRTEFVPKKCA